MSTRSGTGVPLRRKRAVGNVGADRPKVLCGEAGPLLTRRIVYQTGT